MIRHPEHHHVPTNSIPRTRMRTPLQTNQQSVIMAVPISSHAGGVMVSTMISAAASLKPQQHEAIVANSEASVVYYDAGLTIPSVAVPAPAAMVPLPAGTVSMGTTAVGAAASPPHQIADHHKIRNITMADHDQTDLDNVANVATSPTTSNTTTTLTTIATGNCSGNTTTVSTSILGTGPGTVTVTANNMTNMKEKTPMCLVNEMARFNKMQHQYRLTNEQGPAHKKIFTVTLKLGNEEYEAEGASIKKAQHSAAAIALEKTQLKHPPPKSVRPHRLGAGAAGSRMGWGSGGGNANSTMPHHHYPHHHHQHNYAGSAAAAAASNGSSSSSGGGGMVMPTVELNALAMKRGERTVYIVESGISAAAASSTSTMPHHHHQHHHHHHVGWHQAGSTGGSAGGSGGGAYYHRPGGSGGGGVGTGTATATLYQHQHHHQHGYRATMPAGATTSLGAFYHPPERRFALPPPLSHTSYGDCAGDGTASSTTDARYTGLPVPPSSSSSSSSSSSLAVNVNSVAVQNPAHVGLTATSVHKQHHHNMSNGGGGGGPYTAHSTPSHLIHHAAPPHHLGMLAAHHHPAHNHQMSPSTYHHPPIHHLLEGEGNNHAVPLPPPLPLSVRLRIGDREYTGFGSSIQAAKHDAAAKAIVDIKEMMRSSSSSSSSNNNNNNNNKSSNSCNTPSAPIAHPSNDAADATDPNSNNNSHSSATAAPPQPPPTSELISHELKSPISLVYEIALKRHVNVLFEVVSENGPPHLKVFVTRCRIGEVSVVGEGNGKKVSKKRAAEKMLEQLEQCPQQAPLLSPYVQLKRVRPVAKKKGRNLIKVNAGAQGAGAGTATENQEDINPISRLIQIQQANKEKEPVYTVMEERGAPRRREFIIQATVNGCCCKGTGPNKKIAKRNAAQALLTLLGYTTPNAPVPAAATSTLQDKENVVNSNSTYEKSRKVSFQTSKPDDKEPPHTQQQTTATSAAAPPANSGSTVLGAGVGGRQLVPGVLLVNEQTTHGKPKSFHDVADNKGTVKARNHAPLSGGVGGGANPPLNTPGIRAKDKLMYLATLLDIQVQYSDFPKANHDMYLSLVSLNTVPPQVCHGEGATTEASQETAAAEALHVLSELGLDIVPHQEANASNTSGASGDVSDSIKNQSSGMSSTNNSAL